MWVEPRCHSSERSGRAHEWAGSGIGASALLGSLQPASASSEGSIHSRDDLDMLPRPTLPLRTSQESCEARTLLVDANLVHESNDGPPPAPLLVNATLIRRKRPFFRIHHHWAVVAVGLTPDRATSTRAAAAESSTGSASTQLNRRPFRPRGNWTGNF
jgi:hypothetical protein